MFNRGNCKFGDNCYRRHVCAFKECAAIDPRRAGTTATFGAAALFPPDL